jgi:trehalose 6-phosphate phosphatase
VSAPFARAPALPHRAALLLDLDGTLIEIAATPDAVVVPPGLLETLRALRVRLDGALAVVSGRPIAQIDALLDDAPYAVAGEHGGAVRHAPGAPIDRLPFPALPRAAITRAEAAIAAHPGALLERKAHGLVLHYRQAPAAAEALRAAAREIAAMAPGLVVMTASMAWEVKPAGIDKGYAIGALMAHPPFHGRTPVYIGDDVTDEDGMRAARALGGVGWRVHEQFRDPAGVRDWLAGLLTA